MAVVPAQNLPVGSTLPSFIRVTGLSFSTGASISRSPVDASIARKPSWTASTRPPDARSAAAPIIWPTVKTRSRPEPGSVRWTDSPRMSTHQRQPSAAALGRMTRLAERLNAAAGWDVDVHSTTDRREALPGARFVATAVAVDRLASWRTDHELALRHGFASVLSENGGPGGLSHTLRSVPPMAEIAEDIEALAPDALLLNYTNPENRVCLAIRRHTAVAAIGLCHSVR